MQGDDEDRNKQEEAGEGGPKIKIGRKLGNKNKQGGANQ